MGDLVKFLRDMAGDSMGMEPEDRLILSECANRITELERLNEDQSRIHVKQLKESYEISEAHLARLEAVKALPRYCYGLGDSGRCVDADDLDKALEVSK
jgi:hypothetical protein